MLAVPEAKLGRDAEIGHLSAVQLKSMTALGSRCGPRGVALRRSGQRRVSAWNRWPHSAVANFRNGSRFTRGATGATRPQAVLPDALGNLFMEHLRMAGFRRENWTPL